MVDDDSCWVRPWGVEGWESLSESSSHEMFSVGERAAPKLGVRRIRSIILRGWIYL